MILSLRLGTGSPLPDPVVRVWKLMLTSPAGNCTVPAPGIGTSPYASYLSSTNALRTMATTNPITATTRDTIAAATIGAAIRRLLTAGSVPWSPQQRLPSEYASRRHRRRPVASRPGAPGRDAVLGGADPGGAGRPLRRAEPRTGPGACAVGDGRVADVVDLGHHFRRGTSHRPVAAATTTELAMPESSIVVRPDPADDRNQTPSSRLQAAGLSSAITLFAQAARAVPLPTPPQPIVIADYGAGTGHNGLLAIGAAVSVLRGRTRPEHSILVTHTDTADNDFTAMFRTLSEDPDSYL